MFDHWTEKFDWDGAWYMLRDGEGFRHGPYKGKDATLTAAASLHEHHDTVTIIEASHNLECASFIDGQLLLFDLHDDEGCRLPWRMPW